MSGEPWVTLHKLPRAAETGLSRRLAGGGMSWTTQ